MRSAARRELWTLGGVLAIALVLRVVYILGQRGDVLFDFPAVDEERYVAMGRALANGEVPEVRPWFQPPGLVYALGAVFSLAGRGLLAPRIVQALVSTASCGVVYLIARRVFERRVAICTTVLCAIHGVLVFETYELLPPTWILATCMTALWLLLRAGESKRPGASFAAGAALGVAAVFGPTVLPFAAFAAWWLRRPALVGAFLAGVMLPIVPVTWGNWQRGHEVVLVSTNGGINFYIGNSDHYDQTLAIRPGPHWEDLEARPRHAGVTTEGGASAYFYAEGLGFWRDHPARAAGRYLRKLYLYMDGPEIPRDTDIVTMRSGSGVLQALVTRGPPWLPDGVLLPLALVGAAMSWHERRRLALLYGFVVVEAGVIAAFIVTSRYRVPALPVFAMFACEGIRRMATAWRASTGGRRALPVAACFALAVPLNVAARESSGHYDAELDFSRALALRRSLHDPQRALALFQRAAEEDPADGRTWMELGDTLDGLGRTRQAVVAWLRAGEADPWEAHARRKAGRALTNAGDLDGAIAAFQANIDSRAHDDSFYATDHLNLVLLCARRGLFARAVDELRASQRADPRWFRANVVGFTMSALSTLDIDSPELWSALAGAASDAGAMDAAARARARAERR